MRSKALVIRLIRIKLITKIGGEGEKRGKKFFSWKR